MSANAQVVQMAVVEERDYDALSAKLIAMIDEQIAFRRKSIANRTSAIRELSMAMHDEPDPNDRATMDEEVSSLTRENSRDSTHINLLVMQRDVWQRGDGGNCASCGEEISEKRLMACLYNDHCVECAIRREYQDKTQGGPRRIAF